MALLTFIKLFCTNTRWLSRSVVKLCWKAPISAETYKCVLDEERRRRPSPVSPGLSRALTGRGSLEMSSPCMLTGGNSTTVAGGSVTSRDWTWRKSKPHWVSYRHISCLILWEHIDILLVHTKLDYKNSITILHFGRRTLVLFLFTTKIFPN